MLDRTADRAVEEHVRQFFHGHKVDVQRWPSGPIEQRVPDFRVLRVGPGPRLRLWTYISTGCWRATQRAGHGLEFILTAADSNARHVELLTIVAFYHSGPERQRLDVGHTVPIGEPWFAGSHLDHFLVSLPYPYGTDLERCAWPSGHARLLWLTPITAAERDFKLQAGAEALEQRLEEAGAEYWDPHRSSVV